MKKRQRHYERVLVTGATSGIGEALARALPDDTDLLLTGRNADVLNGLTADLGRPGRAIHTAAADLATEAGCATVTQAAENFAIDLFICNAGQGPYGTFLEADPASLRDTVAVNVTAVVVLLRSLLPYLGTYAASKAFDLSLTESLAAELSREPIDILALCPSATRSQFGQRSGFGGNLPGAQDPTSVARAALSAIGRRRTLMPGPLTGPILAGPALVRASIAQGLAFAQRLRR